MVQGSTFFVQSATNLQSPWGRYNPSLLFRILTPHFLWQVKVIVPKISVIMDYTFLWSTSYRVFSETKCWKSCVVFSCSSKANCFCSWRRTSAWEQSEILLLMLLQWEIWLRSPNISLQRCFSSKTSLLKILFCKVFILFWFLPNF